MTGSKNQESQQICFRNRAMPPDVWAAFSVPLTDDSNWKESAGDGSTARSELLTEIQRIVTPV
jgi:hypothetical protein